MRKQKKQERRANETKLREWEQRFTKARASYQGELDAMDWREKLYDGTKEIAPVKSGTQTKKALHVRNIVAELVESQVSSAIPMPKVTAVRSQDEEKAKRIENWIRNELDRLPMEELNDLDERTTYIQGGDHFLVEWDTTARTHTTEGAVEVNLQHPKTVVPQPGVLTGIEDMDYCFVMAARTKKWVRDTYGVDVEDADEAQPQLRAVESAPDADDIVTQIYAFYRNDAGGIGLYSWVEGYDAELCDLEDYQARRERCCTRCGAPGDGVKCAYCGGEEFSDRAANEGAKEGRTLHEDIALSDGRVIPALSPTRDEDGLPVMQPEIDAGSGYMTKTPVLEQTVIPWYKPNVYPIVLRKNVSQFGKYLGGSDVDKIADQQENIKKLETKALEKMLKGGSILAVPKGAKIKNTEEECKLLEVENPADMSKIGVFGMEVDCTGDMNLESALYEEGRSTLGITDSYQGKRDSTATSGTAKQFAASQSAGRLESKRTMKDAAYARLFEIMFKFALAYMDEPREIVFTDGRGGVAHDTFDPFDFLEQDAAGEWYWNDQFLFSVDSSASLVNNREALWQETRMNYQQGCYGQAGTTESLFYFWRIMEKHHYPGAGDMVQIFREKWEQEQAAAQMQAMGGMGAPAAAAAPAGGGGTGDLEAIGAQAAANIAESDAEQQRNAMYINGGGRES